ncbi:flippase [Limosilactobacillus fermentum]
MKRVSVKKNAFLNVIKQICSILFPLITYPYISRILGSSSYGIYSFADSIVGYAVLVADLGVTTYAIREGAKIRDNQNAINDFASEVFSINVVSTLIAYALLVIATLASARIMADKNVVFIRSLIILLTTVGMDWINNIYEDFKYITIRYIAFQTISLVLMFIFVRSSKSLYAYTLITVIAVGGGNLLNIIYIRKYVNVKLKFSRLKQHIKPILILFANNVAVTIYANSDITMLGFYSSNNAVGVYSLASKIYSLAKLMINAVVMVMVPRLSYVVNQKEKYEKYVFSTAKYLIYICLPIVCGSAILSKQILYIVGGNEYLTGSMSLSILSFAIIGAVGGSFFSNCVLLEHKKEKFILISTSISAVLNVGINIFMIPKFGINGAAITTLIAECVDCVLEAIYSREFISISKLISKDYICCFIGSISVLVICCLIKSIISAPIMCVLVSGFLSAVVYVYFISKDKDIRRELLAFIDR